MNSKETVTEKEIVITGFEIGFYNTGSAQITVHVQFVVHDQIEFESTQLC